MIYIIYFLTLYGLSNMLVHSSGPFRIFEHYRTLLSHFPSNIGEGAKCMICTPCQMGILFSLLDIFLLTNISFTPFNVIYGDYLEWYYKIILDGCITSGVVWLIHTIQEMWERANYIDEFVEE